MKRAFFIPTLTVALLAALLLTACTAQAQRSNTRGIFLNATSGRFTVGISWFPSRR